MPEAEPDLNWFHYKFDGGPERQVSCAATTYDAGALAAFGRERVTKFPKVEVPGISEYDGHVLEIWSPRVLPDYGPYLYGIGYNQCGSITITSVSRTENEEAANDRKA